jgi:hypothetical protein
MKSKIYLLTVLALFFNATFSQNAKSDEISKISISKMPNNKGADWKPTIIKEDFEHNLELEKVTYDYNDPVITDITAKPCIDCNGTAQTIIKNRNFIGNNLDHRWPADNYLAVSNSGKIVSVDNNTIEIFNENGVSSGNSTWPNFFTDITLNGTFFDPKVIYDRYSDRFILVVLFHSTDYSDSRILLAFSDPATSSSTTWNLYQWSLPAGSGFDNTTTNKYWYDYPNIGINKNELFVSTNVIKRVSGVNQEYKTVLYQLRKSDGYNNYVYLSNIVYLNFTDNDGNSANTLVPLSDGLQDDTYEDKMYFVNNKTTSPYKTYWYKLTGNISTGNTITKQTLTSTISYSPAPYANQLGSVVGDRIKISVARIRSGYHKNGNLHFVFERGDQGWSEIAYGKINTMQSPLATSITPSTYGGYEFQLNHMYPSISCMSADGEKSIITYALTGPSIYNKIAAIDKQGLNWGSPITIKNGLGLLNLSTYNPSATDPAGTYERIGDYTNIQAKYNSDKSWLVGSYPFGSTPNIHGTSNGLNAWISEVSLNNLWAPIINPNQFSIFPNPNNSNIINVTITDNQIDNNCMLITKDYTGNQVFEKQLFESKNTNIEIPVLEKGIYFVTINSKSNTYENQKLIIN